MSEGFAFAGSAEVIAHRGYSSRAPENTLAAIDLAIEAGADAIEFDLHTAGDGNPVLFHDPMLSRTTNGVGPLKRRTIEQLKNLDAGGWFGAEFSGERIPAFREALEHVGDRVARIYAEVKGFRELEDLDQMVRFATETGQKERTVFIALNWTLLDRMRSQDASLRIGYVVEDAQSAEEALRRATGDTSALIDFKAQLLFDDPSLASRARDAGIELAAWTVDDPSDASRLLQMGVPRITTNEVEALLGWKRAL
jgi:glycerophosphoryl diester phosphodiesterase